MSGLVRRWRPILLLAAVVAVVTWGGRRAWDVQRHRRALAEIQEEMDHGRHGTAVRKLVALLDRRPDSEEALYLLGACESGRRRIQAADQAWVRVPPGSPFAERAIQGRLQLRMERGRLAEAEQIVQAALADPRIDSSGLPILLGPLYCYQGRLDEALRLIEARWEDLDRVGEGDSGEAINLVRAHIGLQQSPVSIAVIRSTLDQAGRLAPEDDRVWLGEANLAIRVGAHDEAARWLDDCLRRRPADLPVWRARLDWALATDRVPEVREALKHLPVEGSTPALVERLAAWLAARRGDDTAERRALERLVAADPAAFAAWDRLAELALREDQPTRASELRRQKAEIEQVTARYHELYQRNQPIRDAAQMAHLAEQLGRRFEARAFLTVAVAAAPDTQDLRRDLARVSQRANTPDQAGRTLADAVDRESR
jgi:predicted Zn-dependent protease